MNLLKNYRFVLLCMLVVVGVGISDLCAWKGAPFVWREWWCAALAALAACGGFVALYKYNNRRGSRLRVFFFGCSSCLRYTYCAVITVDSARLFVRR